MSSTATAVPAFVGYTERAVLHGREVFGEAVPIRSMADFEEVFGGAHLLPSRLQRLKEGAAPADAHDFDFRVASSAYRLSLPEQRFVLHPCLRLFFDNGGGECFVVSAGPYADRVETEALLAGVDALEGVAGPTLLVVPDAVRVADGFAAVVRRMIGQAARLGDRVAVLDVQGTEHLGQPGGPSLDEVIGRFRADVGGDGLGYAAAYFPFLRTSPGAVDYTVLRSGDPDRSLGLLVEILTEENRSLYGNPTSPDVPTGRQRQVQLAIDRIASTTDPAEVSRLTDELTAALPVLRTLLGRVAGREVLLPASAAVAGVIAAVDADRGPWAPPANVALNGVLGPSVVLREEEQAGLNQPLDGRAVNALRQFPGRGSLVWGARTLDGNSPDFRYLHVRRTMIHVERSLAAVLRSLAGESNDARTWSRAISQASAFLQGLWSAGGLQGSTAAEAFAVRCGLGSTMTAQDLVDGRMILQVMLQMTRPGEFVETTLVQPMAAG